MTVQRLALILFLLIGLPLIRLTSMLRAAGVVVLAREP